VKRFVGKAKSPVLETSERAQKDEAISRRLSITKRRPTAPDCASSPLL
jgi:hypothetical protein